MTQQLGGHEQNSPSKSSERAEVTVTKDAVNEKAALDVNIHSFTMAVKILRQRQSLPGSAGTGTDGQTNRVYTIITSNVIEIVEVFVDGVLYTETAQYTVDNTAKTVTILTNVWDSQTITVFYNV